MAEGNRFLQFTPLQIYAQFQKLNRKLRKCAVTGDIGKINEIVDEFLGSGITENEHYWYVLAIFRISERQYYMEGIPANAILQALDEDWYFRDMQGLFPDDTEAIEEMLTVEGFSAMKYALESLVGGKPEAVPEKKLVEGLDPVTRKRYLILEEYSRLYNRFINDEGVEDIHRKYETETLFDKDYIRKRKNQKKPVVQHKPNDICAYQEYFFQYIDKLIAIREGRYSFKTEDGEEIKTDEWTVFATKIELLGEDTVAFRKKINYDHDITHRMKLIKERIDQVLGRYYEALKEEAEETTKDETAEGLDGEKTEPEKKTEKKPVSFSDYVIIKKVDYKEDDPVNVTEYLNDVAMIGEGLFHRLQNGDYPKDKYFFIALAFYLWVPNSQQLEKFLNKWGYSLGSPVEVLNKIVNDGKGCDGVTYVIRCRDIKKYIDCGMGYEGIFNLIQHKLKKEIH